jgi:sensor histidine kinase YesM
VISLTAEDAGGRRLDGHGGAGMLYARHFLEVVYGHHACIETTAIPGEGTTVILTVPLRPGEATLDRVCGATPASGSM